MAAKTAPAAPAPPGLAALAASSPADRLRLLASHAGGITSEEALRRRRAYGANEPVRPERTRILATFAGNFTHTLALLLWFAAGLSFASGIPELGAAIVAVIGINGVFAFLQEHRAEQVVRSLMRQVAVQARVLRGGSEQRIPAVDLVPGDVVRLAAGDIVPADCVLLATDNLTVDLSMITGESTPVQRDARVISVERDGVRATDVTCIAPSGSGVATGSGEAVVWTTGPDSTMGQVAALVEGVRRGESVLERQVTALSRLTAVLAVLAGAATLSVAAFSTNIEFLTALTFATGVIVALVPEGLLPTLSVSLAIGARRMAERGAAIRRLSAVEAVGSVTVICTDKTGTLTQNTLSVLGFTGASTGPPAEALLTAALCNDARLDGAGFAGDPIDVALAGWAAGNGQDVEALRRAHRRIADMPFDASRRYMSVTCDVGGAERDFIKGAPEAVLALIANGETPAPIAAALAAATQRGERVILLASGPRGQTPAVLGLVRLYDPPRPEVPAAIAACRRARIRIIMLTGDHPSTAQAVAAAIGMAEGELPVVDGATVDQLSDAQLLVRLRTDAIFARIDPRQKLRITMLLRRAGDIVVVTGDGINDAPALRAADVGVAMGRRGTEVAKQAADIVLADDNFATIVAAIEEGRSIKTNIRRFASYVFTHNVAELAPFLIYVFFPVALPLKVAQVLAIDLGTDLSPSLALGAEPPSPAAMDEPPEPPERPLLTGPLVLKTFLFFGVIEAALGLAGFFSYFVFQGWRPFDALGPYSHFDSQARAMTFLGIVSGQVGCVFAQRDGSFAQRLSLTSNAWIRWGVLFELALALTLVYVPGVNGLFSMEGVPPAWLAILPLGAATFFLIDHARRITERMIDTRRA
jgi:calcium-translocating P-type ATPase